MRRTQRSWCSPQRGLQFSEAKACLTIAVTLPLLADLLVALASANGWVPAMPMVFFAFIAVLLIIADWRVILAGTITTALHHLLLNFLRPTYIFPDGSDLLRVLFHALVVLFEAGVLMTMCHRFETLVRGLSEARAAQAALDAEHRDEREAIAVQQSTVIASLSDRLSALAAGDLVSQIITPFPGEYETARTMLNRSCQELEELVSAVALRADGVATGAHELREASGDLAGKTEHQTAALENAVGTTGKLLRAIEAPASL